MWQLHSGNFVVSRSFLRSTRSFVDGVVVNEKKRKYDYKTSQFNDILFFTYLSMYEEGLANNQQTFQILQQYCLEFQEGMLYSYQDLIIY